MGFFSYKFTNKKNNNQKSPANTKAGDEAGRNKHVKTCAKSPLLIRIYSRFHCKPGWAGGCHLCFLSSFTSTECCISAEIIIPTPFCSRKELVKYKKHSSCLNFAIICLNKPISF